MTNDLVELSQELKALGHPVRLKLLSVLLYKKEQTMLELLSHTEQSQPIVSQHLAILRKRGIVRSRKVGNKRIYSIPGPFMHGLIAYIFAKRPDTY